MSTVASNRVKVYGREKIESINSAVLVFGRELGRINPEPASSRFCSCPSPDALWPTRHNRLQSLFALRAELAEGPLCAPAVAVTITASNVETRARSPDSCKLPISNSFASSPLVDPIGHSLIIPTLIRSWRCSVSLDNMLRRTSVCRKSDMRRPK